MEGEVGLPDKVLASLGLKDLSPDELRTHTVHVKYIRLHKITYVKFQPILNKFFNLGPVKLVLEQNLRFHATLTLGDEVTVWHRGESYELRVTDIKPGTHGTLIDTDVEVDLDLSDEYLQSEKYKAGEGGKDVVAAAAARKGQTLGGGVSNAAPVSVFASVPTPASVPEAHPSAPRQPVIALPAEPGGDAPRDSVIRCKVKTASRALARVFSVDDAFDSLFAYVRNESAPMEGRLVLSTRFPPKDLLEGSEGVSGRTFKDLGFSSGQEMFHLSTQ